MWTLLHLLVDLSVPDRACMRVGWSRRYHPFPCVHSPCLPAPYLLQWARSLFGDEFEASARAVALFRDDPAGWIATRRAEAKTRPAPSAIKAVLETLEAATAPTLQLCIDRARLLFERFFVTRMRNLAYTLPEDHVDPDTKKAYWG